MKGRAPGHGGVRIFALLGLALLALVLHRFWFGESGYFAVRALEERAVQEQRITDRYEERNRILTAEVRAMRDGLQAIEARARTDLGMVAPGEMFYLVVEDPRAERAAP